MERRITGTVGTIPNYTAIAATTVTSQTDATVLISTGTDDLEEIFRPGSIGLNNTNYWVYVPDGSPKIAPVTGLYKIGETAGTFTFRIQLGVAMTGASTSDVNYIKTCVAFSYVNDGGSTGTIGDGTTQVVVKDGEGETYSPYEKYSNRPQMQPVKYVDASSTNFFIQEEI